MCCLVCVTNEFLVIRCDREYVLCEVERVCCSSWNSIQELGLAAGQASKQDSIFMKKVNVRELRHFLCRFRCVCMG